MEIQILEWSHDTRSKDKEQRHIAKNSWKELCFVASDATLQGWSYRKIVVERAMVRIREP